MSDQRKDEVVAQLADQVIAKLTAAFFEVVTNEKWGKRDLAKISGLNETQIGHILAGRRKNLTTETIALLARAMRKRPELVFQDMRPKGNRAPVPPQLTTTQNKLTFGKKRTNCHNYDWFSLMQAVSAVCIFLARTFARNGPAKTPSWGLYLTR